MKLCLVGDRCGKTSIIQRWIHPNQSIVPERTIAIDMKSMVINENDTPVVIQMWDCCGESFYRELLDKYLFNANCIVVCFDLTKPYSWLTAQFWLDRARDIASETPICVIGNKLDKESARRIKAEVVKKYIDLIPIPYIFYCEVSAYTGEECRDTLRMIVREGRRNLHVYNLKDFKKRAPEKSCTIV